MTEVPGGSIWFSCRGSSYTGVMEDLGSPDVNGDDYVLIDDISFIACRFGISVGDENWDDRADIIPDGSIMIDDISCVAKLFGQKW